MHQESKTTLTLECLAHGNQEIGNKQLITLFQYHSNFLIINFLWGFSWIIIKTSIHRDRQQLNLEKEIDFMKQDSMI